MNETSRPCPGGVERDDDRGMDRCQGRTYLRGIRLSRAPPALQKRFLLWGVHTCPAEPSVWPSPGARTVLTSPIRQGPWRPCTSFVSSTQSPCCGSSRKGCLLFSPGERGVVTDLPPSRLKGRHQQGQINTAGVVPADTDGYHRGKPSPRSAPEPPL